MEPTEPLQEVLYQEMVARIRETDQQAEALEEQVETELEELIL